MANILDHLRACYLRTPGAKDKMGMRIRWALGNLGKTINAGTDVGECNNILTVLRHIIGTRLTKPDDNGRTHLQHYMGDPDSHCRSKRAILHVLTQLALTKCGYSIIDQICQCIVHTLIAGQGEPRVESSAKVTVDVIFKRYGTFGADAFVTALEAVEEQGVLKEGPTARSIIRRSLTLLHQLNFSPTAWDRVQTMMKQTSIDLDDPMWASHEGKTFWDTGRAPTMDWDEDINLTMTSHNQNGIKDAWGDGRLLGFIRAHNSDIMHFAEIKASLDTLARPWEFWSSIRALGYHQLIMVSCTGPGGVGNYGSMVIRNIS